jgi:hypothetical protein
MHKEKPKFSPETLGMRQSRHGRMELVRGDIFGRRENVEAFAETPAILAYCKLWPNSILDLIVKHLVAGQ